MSRLVAIFYWPIALVACVDTGDEGMYVVNNTAISGTTCTLNGSLDQPFLSHGAIYSKSPLPYLFTPLIQSRIQSVDGVDDLSKTIQLSSADVKLTLKAMTIGTTTTQSNTALPSFTSLFAGPLPPGGTVNVGFDLVPAGTIASLAAMGGAEFSAEVLAEITVKGTLSGDEVTSQPYNFPVTVCTDCVVRNVGACPMMGTPRTGNPCNPYQDGVVDCCDAGGGNLVCPATTM
jgi:hypothetical protein